MPKLRLIDGNKPPPDTGELVACKCGHTGFTPETVGLLRIKGKIVKPRFAHTQWVCKKCGRPAS